MVFVQTSNHLEVRRIYSSTGRIFNSLLGVCGCDQTRPAEAFQFREPKMIVEEEHLVDNAIPTSTKYKNHF